jgi:hypothetical protein
MCQCLGKRQIDIPLAKEESLLSNQSFIFSTWSDGHNYLFERALSAECKPMKMFWIVKVLIAKLFSG